MSGSSVSELVKQILHKLLAVESVHHDEQNI